MRRPKMSKAWSIWCAFVLLLAEGSVCGEIVQVTVRLDGEPRVGALVQAYSTGGVYLGMGAVTNASGVATFDISAAVEAKYRTVHCGTAFWTAPLIAPATATIDLPIASTITVTSGGQAAVGRTVQLWNQSGTIYLGEQRTTGADGKACFAPAATTHFRFRIADSGSQLFTNVLTAPVDTTFDLPVPSTVAVTYAGEPGAGLTVQLWSTDQTIYLNQSRTTDVNGNAQFSIAADQAFRFRATYGNRHFWTEVLTAPATASLAIPSLSVVSLTVTSGGQPAPGRVVQVWNSTSTSYLDQSKTTSPSGQVSFLIPTDDQVRLRVTESGANLWTEILTAPADATLDIPVLSTVTVTHDGGAAAGRTVQLWSSDQSTYLGISRVTDANGVATFTIATGMQVKFRVTDNGVNLWSDVITTPASTTIDIPVASTVTVTKAGAPVEGRTIYLFDSAGTYLGQSKVTDANGVATFTIATGMQVKFRVTDNGKNFWSEVITAPADTAVSMPPETVVHVLNGLSGVSELNVYAFDADNTYLNYVRKTDSLGIARFTLEATPDVKFRVTWGETYFWSELLTPPPDEPVVLQLGYVGDTTPPVTTINVSYGQWFEGTHKDLVLTAVDAESGVAHTYYSLNDAPMQEGTTFRVEGQGLHTILFYSVDVAGNTESGRYMVFGLDDTAPQLSDWAPAELMHTPYPVVSITIVDEESGIDSASMTLNDEPVPTEFSYGYFAFTPYTPLPNGLYTVSVTVSNGAGITVEKTWTFSIEAFAPEITQQPQDQTVLPGNPATFTVSATGTPSPTYQWLQNGVAIDGATSPTLTLQTVTLYDDNSTIKCRVSNVAGTVLSDAATLVVPRVLAVTTLSPTDGQLSGGTWVDLLGENFSPQTTVTFGGVMASEIKYYHSGKIYAIAPAGGAAGPVDLVVTEPLSGTVTLPGAFTYVEDLSFSLDGIEEDDVLAGNTSLTLTGSLQGGTPPYTLTITHYSEPTITTQTVGGAGPFASEIPFDEGFHYVFVMLADSSNKQNLAWTRFYYLMDTTPPDVPTGLRSYPAEDGTGAHLLWIPSDSADAVTYKIDDQSQAAAPVNVFQLTDLTEGQEYTVDIKAVDRAENESVAASVTFTAQKLHDLHDLKKKVEEIRIGLSFYSTGITWSKSFGTLDELLQLRAALETFDNEVHEDFSNSHVLRLYTDYDAFGINGQIVDVSWPKVRIPGDTPWLQLETFVTSDAVDRVSDAAARLSLWKQVPANQISLVTFQSDYLNRNKSGNYPWAAALADLPLRVQQEVTESSVTWYESYDELNWWGPYTSAHDLATLADVADDLTFSTYGSAGNALYNNDGMYEWYDTVLQKYIISDLTLHFPDDPVYEAYFWTDHAGPITPGQQIGVSYPADDWASTANWADPANNLFIDDPWWQQGESCTYSQNYGKVSPYVYRRHKERPLELIATIISPASSYVEVGDEVIVEATAIYAVSDWGDEKLNGQYDLGETFTDVNGNGVWDDGEPFSDANGNGQYDPGEYFSDINGNGVYDPPEPFVDLDAVFVHIPAQIRCENPAGYTNNFGGSKFVGLVPGRYTITTNLDDGSGAYHGHATITVIGVDVEITDTAGYTLNWQDEDLYGALQPVNNALNPQTSTVKFFAYHPDDVEGTYTISIGPGIELWNNEEPLLNSDTTTLDFTRATLPAELQLRGTEVAESSVTLDFTPASETAVANTDSVKITTVKVEVELAAAFSTGGSLIRINETTRLPDGEHGVPRYEVVLPSTFRLPETTPEGGAKDIDWAVIDWRVFHIAGGEDHIAHGIISVGCILIIWIMRGRVERLEGFGRSRQLACSRASCAQGGASGHRGAWIGGRS